jgi:hypothetical protein
MKRIVMVLMLIVFLPLFLNGCTAAIEQAKRVDASMAGYLGKEKLSLDCRAGIAKADMDVNGSVAYKNVEAVARYADQESQDFKDCYAGVAWLYYVGAQMEGSIKALVKKAAELGVMK